MFTLVKQAEPVVGKKKVDRYTAPFLWLAAVEGLQTSSPLTAFACEDRSSAGNLFLRIFYLVLSSTEEIPAVALPASSFILISCLFFVVFKEKGGENRHIKCTKVI